MIEGKKILITGGAGFIGSALVRKLQKHNKILIYDNLRRDAFKYFKNEIDEKKVQKIKGDILESEFLKGVVQGFGPDIVIHLAAMAGVTSYYKEPVRTMEVNAVGSYNVLEAVKDMDLERFVYFSTSEVYGPMVFGAKEDMGTAQGPLTQRRWTYSISKLAGEAMSYAFGSQYKFPVTSIRPFNVYGPGQVGEGAIQIFARKAINNETIQITNDGNQIRAWCYIDDFVDGTLAAVENKKAIGEVFNIGDPEATVTILNLVKRITRISKSDSKVEFIPHPGTDVDLRVPNIQKAAKILGYKPKYTLEEGLKKSIKWYSETKLAEEIA